MVMKKGCECVAITFLGALYQNKIRIKSNGGVGGHWGSPFKMPV